MQNNKTTYKFLFAGGGTGGHLFPAVAVAEKIKQFKPDAEILFIGTRNKIEALVVPKLGFRFKSIWIKGFARKFDLQNLLFPLKVVVSMLQSLVINLVYKPDVAIGSGGYVSGPAVWSASVLGAKVILLEQNSFPGITTRLLEKKADEIHISFEDTEKYLKGSENVFLTGNPVRSSLTLISKEEACRKLQLDPAKKVLLILGGSLGAGSINKALSACVNELVKNDIQVIWQTGKNYYESYKNLNSQMVLVKAFIDDMSAAFSACDLLISRAGATTIAEVTTLGIPTVFIPSPNVAANHQYMNAKSLSDKDAAVLLPDSDAQKNLLQVILGIIRNNEKLMNLKNNIMMFSRPDAAEIIAKSAIKMAEQ